MTTQKQQNSESKLDSLPAIIPQHLWHYGGIIEIISEQHDSEELKAILPILSMAINKQRWLAWVAPPFKYAQKGLNQEAGDPCRLLKIYPGKNSSHLDLFRKALSTGRCSAVIAWSKQHDHQELKQLKYAARKGKALGILLSRNATQENDQCNADLQITISHIDDTIVYRLKGPHIIGQKCYQQNATQSEIVEIEENSDTITVLPKQLSFF